MTSQTPSSKLIAWRNSRWLEWAKSVQRTPPSNRWRFLVKLWDLWEKIASSEAAHFDSLPPFALSFSLSVSLSGLVCGAPLQSFLLLHGNTELKTRGKVDTHAFFWCDGTSPSNRGRAVGQPDKGAGHLFTGVIFSFRMYSRAAITALRIFKFKATFKAALLSVSMWIGAIVIMRVAATNELHFTFLRNWHRFPGKKKQKTKKTLQAFVLNAREHLYWKK